MRTDSGQRSAGAEAPGAARSLVARLREVHLRMVDAVLAGEGLERVAALAAAEAGAPVAIVVPRIGAAAVAPSEAAAALASLTRYVVASMRDRSAKAPGEVALEVPISAGDERVGAVLALRAAAAPDGEVAEVLHLAAVASLTELAVLDAKEEVEQTVRGSLLEEIRTARELDGPDVARRAARLGCDLSAGALVICAEVGDGRPRRMIAAVAEEFPGALAQSLDGRVYGVLPVRGPGSGDGVEAARRVAARLRRHGSVGLSPVYRDAGELHRAVQEAELAMEVLRASGEPVGQDVGRSGAYRLLFRVLASHPDEVRGLYEESIGPIVRYDEQYGAELVTTLEAYLANDCNMNATAAAIYAHRHTVAYRLERIAELTGLSPTRFQDRERLGLGLKAHRIIGPRLPR